MTSAKIISGCLILGALVALPFAAYAQTAPAERYQLIAGHCNDLHNLVSQLQRRDLVSRTNLGREYESIDNQLNAFNQRIKNNNLDSQPFAQLLTQFDDAVNQFRDAYVHYDDGLNKLEGVDCQKSPADFDNQLTVTRTLRDAAQADAARAQAITGQYRDLAAALQAQLPPQQSATGGTQ